MEIREHPPAAREALRRAGLSTHSELTPDEAARAREAGERFPDPRTPAAQIRGYILPRPAGEGVTDERKAA